MSLTGESLFVLDVMPLHGRLAFAADVLSRGWIKRVEFTLLSLNANDMLCFEQSYIITKLGCSG